jgi:hypothetical protein
MNIRILALALISALSAHAAEFPTSTPIKSLPVTITKPGNYYFVANMYVPTPGGAAITIQAPGSVVIDMRGFTLTGPEFSETGSYGINILSSNVTIENGKFAGFGIQIVAGAVQSALTGIYLLNLSCGHLGGDSIDFQNVDNSVVRDCVFSLLDPTGFDGFSPNGAIYDAGSGTGNSYVNDKVVAQSSSVDVAPVLISQSPSVNVTYTLNISPVKQ